MSSNKKCANAACSCVPPDKAKFCSAHCEGIGNKTEISCTCGHEGCMQSLHTPQAPSGTDVRP